MRDAFLRGARAVQVALDDPAVAAAWDEPSVLDGQSIGGLAGHLARGAVWVVADYLDAAAPPAATVPDAATYFAGAVAALDDDGHRAIRWRGAEVGALGPEEVRARLAERLDRLEVRLTDEPVDRLVPVFGGAMELDAYLVTRIVEQVVHLDDLARSLGRDAPVVPDDLVAVAARVGVEVARARHGGVAVLRHLYRGTEAGVVPVLA